MFTLRIRDLFFDRHAVQRAADRARSSALTAGARAIRDEARTSMPAKAGLAAPGRPPRMESAWLKRSVLSAWDPSTKTAVAGPVRMAGTGARAERMLMRVLEFGGPYELGKKAKRRRKIPLGRKVVVRVLAKPYMGPALDKERPRLPNYWAGRVRGG